MDNKISPKPLKIIRKIGVTQHITPVDFPVDIDDKMEHLNAKQRLVVQAVLEHPEKSKREVLLAAGYSAKGSGKKPAQVFNNPVVKDALETYVQRLQALRVKATNHLEIALEDQKKVLHPRDAVAVIDALTKNIQLLTGKATANVGLQIQEEHRVLVEAVILENIPETEDDHETS